MADRELQDAERDLHVADPAEFVRRRGELVALARERGAGELAERVRALRKPTTAAWAVNLLAVEEADRLAELLDLGDRLRAAQRDLRGAELRDLAAQRSRALAELTDRAAALAADRGHPLAESARRQVEQTLTAALSDPEAGARVRAAALEKPLEYSGFGLDELSVEAIRRAAEQPPERTRGTRTRTGTRRDEETARKRSRQAERERRAAREQADKAAESLREADEALERAERARRAADDRREELRERLRHAEAELRQQRREVKAAREHRERAQREVDAAERELRRREGGA
ncbi:hypothetical protein [Saccharopolyspora rosea]|uniref:Transposase n=1 Tax=Saccharopolyspora rosea TaxID=524884 RepID=A0ABW3FP95_9PSEU|nr:hypothetical protein [Saccharopolyspora rosea]